MPFLVAAVVALGLLTLLNLALTVGVIRRLREHGDVLARRVFGPESGARVLPVGATVAGFTATTTDGEPVSTAELVGETLVGLFSTGCRACDDLVPEFVRYAATVPGGRGAVLAVVEAVEAEAGPYVTMLSPVARVVVEPPGVRGVLSAFGVRGLPAICLLDGDGRITAAGHSLDDLPAPARS